MANCIYKYKGKDYTKEEFYSLVSNSNFIQQEQTHILGSKQDIEGFKKFNKNGVFLSSSSYASQVLNEDQLSIFKRLQLGRLVSKVAAPFTVRGTNQKLYSIPKIKEDYDGNIIYKKDYSKKRNLDTLIKEQGWDWIRTRETQDAIMVELGDFTGDQLKIFDSLPSETQSSPASSITQKKVLQFLSNIGFTDIQSVKTLMHNGEELEGNAYVDMINAVMQIVEGQEDVSLPEEAMHILVELVQKADPALFRAMEKQVVDYDLYRRLLRDPAYTTNKYYKTASGAIDYNKLKKEAIAKLLAEYLIGNTEGTIESQNKVLIVNTWWRQLVNWIKRTFGPYKNPFKEALSRLETDNQAFGVFSDLSPEDQLFLSATKKNMTTRDEEYKATKTAYENIKNKAADSGVTKINNAYYKDGKRWAYSESELKDMTDDQLAAAAREFAVTPGERYKTIGEIRKNQGKRVSDLKDAFYKSLFKNKPLDQDLMPIFERMAEDGNFIHTLLEDAVNALIDGKTGLLRDKPGTPNTSLSSDRVQVGMQNQINKFIKGFVSAFPEGTRFLSETIVYDEFTKELGTVDFMAIIPILDENGKVTGEKIDIYDWKSILFNTVESVKDYKKEGFNIQLNEYKRILRDSYGISQFGKIRAIPVKRIYGKEVNGVKPLAGIQIGDVDPSKINDIQLRPIISNEESTGDKQKDDVITKLNGIYQTFVNKLKQGKLQGREILSEIDNAIYELRVSDSVTQLRIYLKDLEGKVSQLLSNIEANKSVDKDVLDDYLLDISLYETIFESISAVRLLDETGLSLDEKQKLANVIYVLEKKVIILKEKRKELVAKQAEKDNIFGLLSPEKVVKGLTKIFRSLGNQPVATMRYLYKLASRSYTRIDMETDEELKKLQELRLRFSEYAKRKGLSNKDAIKKLVNFEKGSLHSKVDKSFFEQREVVVESKNAEKIKDFIRNNYNYQEYAIWYQAELKKNTDFWESLKGSYDVDPKEDEKIRKIKRLNFEKNYNIERFPLTAFSPYNKQLWNKNIIEEKWLSKEYEEIQKDNDLKEMYEFFMRKNKELLAVGAIEEWQSYSFLPNVRKTYADIFSFQDVNWFEKIKDTTFNGLKKWKKSLTVEDYESNYLPERDPITGEITDRRFVRFVTKLDNNTEIYAKVADKLGIKRKGTETLLQSIERWKLESPGNPKKFEDEVISLREMSFDIFAIYGLMSKEIAKEKYLQENDEVIRALVHIEKTKKNYETNKWGNITMNGNVPVMPDNLIGQNAPLLEQYAKAVTEGQSIQVDTDNAITFGIRKRWNESFAGKIYKFNINPDTYKPTSISTTKFLMWLNNVHQKRVLGLNLSSAASNLFGGTFSSDKLYSKYVSREDLAKAWTQLTSVAWYQSDDMRKRAALVDYFLPLLNNREAHKSSQLSVNQSVKILSQEWLMSPMRTTDELVQLHIFLAHLENTGLKEGKLVNLRELAAKETNYFDRYKLPVDQRSKVEENFEKHLEKLKKDFSLSKQSIYKTVKINGKDETVIDIPGIERTSDEVHKMRNLSQTMAKDALGAMDEYDYAPYRMNIYWRLFMTFKNWIPRGGDVRFGEFHYSESHNSHEYGRFRMLWRSFATNYVASVSKMIPVVGNLTKKWGREDIIQKAIKVYEEKKRMAQQLGQYDENFITQGEFVDMFVKGTEATFAEFRTITLMMSLLVFGIMKGDDDDSAEEKSFKALMRRQIDKMQDEVSFFYSPKSGIDIAGTTAPLIGLVRDSYSLFNNFSKEMFGIAFETIGFEETGVEMQEKAKPLKYTFKTLPVLKEILTYMPLIDNEIAKDWGVRVQNRNGF